MNYRTYCSETAELLEKVRDEDVSALAGALEAARNEDRLIFLIGNGGSGASASHLCEDLGKGTLTDFDKQKRVRVISLTDNTPYILAWGNDEGYERVFVEQLRNLAVPGALLIAISGSGNSPNVIEAVRWANTIGMTTFGVTGFDGGELSRIAHRTLHVPSHDMGMVEAVHGVIFHYLVDELRERFREAT